LPINKLFPALTSSFRLTQPAYPSLDTQDEVEQGQPRLYEVLAPADLWKPNPSWSAVLPSFIVGSRVTGRVNESLLLALRERMGEWLPECRGGGSSQCIIL